MDSLESFLLGWAASAAVWWWVWRGLGPRLGLSPYITPKSSNAEVPQRREYRFKIKNMHRNIDKRHAMDVSYSAHLRYRKRNKAGNFGNWATVPLRLSTKERIVLLDNVLIAIKVQAVSKETRSHLHPPLDADALDIYQLLTHLADARIYITCLATDSYSGSRRGVTQHYDAQNIGGKFYKSGEILKELYGPKNPPGYWRIRFDTVFRRKVHPELQVLTESEENRLGLNDTTDG